MMLSGIALLTMLQATPFGIYEGRPVTLYTLRNSRGMTAKIMDYGATVVSLTAPDRRGKYAEVTLGFPKFDDYPTKSPYFGCIAGRVANRIGRGTFDLEGNKYDLFINNGPNTLHGGEHGFDKKIWKVVSRTSGKNPSITLQHVSPDGEEGYPGELTAQVKYTLTSNNTIKIDYDVRTKALTIQNLTNHMYFNLEGAGSKNILNHKMQISADSMTPVGEDLIPTGEIATVYGTPFNFNLPTPIGTRIDSDDEQLKFGGGYDHNWVLKGKMGTLRKVAAVHEPKSGRYMEVLTTEPGIQFYSGNFLDGTLKGHGGVTYNKRYGFCLETQHYPDSVNHPNFPTTTLKPGNVYKSTTVYAFKTK